MKKGIPIILLLIFSNLSFGQNLLTYIGNNGKECLYDATQLSDSTFLVCGFAENLNWIGASVPRTVISSSAIKNGGGTNKFGFILQISQDLATILNVVHFPANAVEDVRFIKTTNVEGQPTGDLFISGNTIDTRANDGGYFIARLNNNFVNGVPTGIVWAKSIWAEGYVKSYHPWDVSGKGEVYFTLGQSHGYDWGIIHKTDVNGNLTLVENWRVHFDVGVTEFYGRASQYTGGTLDYSGILFKESNRCDLRSRTQAEFDSLYPDGNGGLKKGKWPMDLLYDKPCDRNNYSSTGPGYCGYRKGNTAVHGVSSIVVNRLDGSLFVGMNIKSVWVSNGQGDFEPAVIKYDSTGNMKWWSRLYHEITPAGDTNFYKSHDQYIDALAFDYANDQIVVAARVHGNCEEPYWRGNKILDNPTARGFQNNFTGSNGNIHLTYLAKLKNADGTLRHSTYMAEYAEAATNLGTPLSDPNLQGWPNPNTGWPTLNSTDISENSLKVSRSGLVCLVASGRRTITTRNAHQKMVLPANGGLSCWNQFVRIYSSNLQYPMYSSLVVGKWDTTNQQGGSNTILYGVYKSSKGVLAVGCQTANTAGVPDGNPIPVANTPFWGSAIPENQSGIFAMFTADSLRKPEIVTRALEMEEDQKTRMQVYPNPFSESLQFKLPENEFAQSIQLSTVLGTVLSLKSVSGESVHVKGLPSGLYFLQVRAGNGKVYRERILKGRE